MKRYRQEIFYENLKEKLQLLLFTGTFILILLVPFLSNKTVQQEYSGLFILLGVLLGVFNVNKEEYKNFAIYGICAIITISFLLNQVDFAEYLLSAKLILYNLGLTIGAGLLTVSLGVLSDILQLKDSSNLQDINLSGNFKRENKFKQIWDIIIFTSILFLLFVFAMDYLGIFSSNQNYIVNLYTLLNGIFIVDLIMIYFEKKSLSRMLKENSLDIIAAIPFYNIFRVAKLLRVVKMIRVIKLNGFLKYFNNNSAADRLLLKSKTRLKK